MKKAYSLVLIAILYSSCTSTLNNSKTSAFSIKATQTALQYLGSPYKAAGTTRAGFDCSGLVFTTLRTLNIDIPRSSIEQSRVGIILGQNKRKAQKGDLIFFKTNNSQKINHVGIVTDFENDDLIFIHSSTSKGVILSSTKEPFYQKSFVQLNRIFQN